MGKIPLRKVRHLKSGDVGEYLKVEWRRQWRFCCLKFYRNFISIFSKFCRNLCRNFSIFFEIFRNFSKFFEILQSFAKFVENRRNLSKNVEIYRKTSKFCGFFSTNFDKFRKILTNFANFRKMSQKFEKFRKFSQNFDKISKIFDTTFDEISTKHPGEKCRHCGGNIFTDGKIPLSK